MKLIDTTKLEYQSIRAKIVSKYFFILNVYIRPGKAMERRVMVHELDVILNAVRTKYPADEILILGDFNMPNIVWTNDDGTPKSLPKEAGCSTYERLFIKLIHKYSLAQMNTIANSNGVVLDLVLTSVDSAFSVEMAPPEAAWDKTSASHLPLTVTYTAKMTPIDEKTYTNVNKRILLRQSSTMLQNTQFPYIDFDDSTIDSGGPALRKTNKVIKNLVDVQARCTIVKKNSETQEKKHPWARGKKYLMLKYQRNALQKLYRETWLISDKN